MKTAELADQHSKHDHFVYMVKWVPRNAQQGMVFCPRESTPATSLNAVQHLLTHSLPVKLKLRGYVFIRDFVGLLDVKLLAPVSTVIGMISSSCQRPCAGL